MIRRPVLTALVAGVVLLAGAPAALAVQPRHTSVVSAVPQDGTPQIQNGAVFAITQVGGTTVVGGTFTSTASSDPTRPLSTPYVLAFDAVTGAVRTSFLPQLDGTVYTLLPGPTTGTVYVGGAFRTVRGAPAKGLVLLDLRDGSRVGGFVTPPTDGTVQSVKRLGNRLFVGGTFRKVGGLARGGLATLDATTGALDGYLTSSVATNHNWTPSSPPTWAKGAVGVTRLDLTPDGTRMVAIGNFKQVDGVTHDQIAMWDLTAGGAAVRAWNTTRLEPACLESRYDSYARDVDFSPDGAYFSLVTVGGYREGMLCDSASRWETAASGPDVQPTWVAYTGGDSLLSTAVTGEAVYVGGHQRWLNNDLAHDKPGPGAVPRPGLAALDPVNGLPLAWNPGRNPRGAGTYALYATSAGLWTGSDTDFIGNRRYKRAKVAFFPLAGGAPAASTAVPVLPGQVFQGAVPAAAPTGVLHRVNAGGALLQSTDGGPDWAGDTGSASPYRNGGGSVPASYGSPVPRLDASVPAGTPPAVFSTERQDRGTKGDTGELQWRFAVPAGTQVELRLYLASRCPCATAPGSRTFDVTVDGALRANDLDVLAEAGAQTGTMRRWTLTSDGVVDVAFGHEAGDPFVNALEVVRAGTGPEPSPAGTLTSRPFDGTTAGAATAASGPLDVSQVRGSTVIGSTLFYGRTDGKLYRRAITGSSYGPEVLVDPYNDPYWSDVDTGSGNLYRGTQPAFYDEITQLTSLSYDRGRLYYTLYRQPGLFYRDFSPDSGVVSSTRQRVEGVTLPDITGAFLAGGQLFYATRADGNLNRVGFDGTRVTGPPTVVSGPAQGGIDWRTRVLHLGPAAGPQPPSAAFTASCSLTACTYDGSASADADGTITAYAWTFGDGDRGTGATPRHTYAQPGTYTVTLTVTDSSGATASSTQALVVQGTPTSPIAFRGSSSVLGTTSAQLQVPVPAGTRPGDALLLRVSTSGTTIDPRVPAGWTELSRQTAGTMLTVLWQRAATTADTPGSSVPVTLATGTKSSSQLLAYGGTAASPVTAVAGAADTALVTEHTAPAVQVARSGSWVVRFWADKSSTTTGWTLPGGTLRATSSGTGSGYLTAIVTDDGVAQPAGTAPALTAVTDAPSRATMTSVVLAPAG